jgi:hypothetical protein
MEAGIGEGKASRQRVAELGRLAEKERGSERREERAGREKQAVGREERTGMRGKRQADAQVRRRTNY